MAETESQGGVKRRTWIAVGAGLVALGGIAFVVVGAIGLLQARTNLNQARSTLAALDGHPNQLLSSQGRATAAVELARAKAEARSASATISSNPALSVAGFIPGLHAQHVALLQMSAAVQIASDQGIGLIGAVDTLTRQSDGLSVSLSSLQALDDHVAKSAQTLSSLKRSSSGLLWPLSTAQDSINSRLARITNQLDRGTQILRYAEVFLGDQGQRQYVLAAENTSEMRDQGSPLSLAQVTASAGHLSVSSPSSYDNYPLGSPVSVPTPSGTVARFGQYLPTQLWQNVNMTANFPWSGSALVAMYRTATGVQDNGVIAVDPHALAGLLWLSGPVKVPGISGLVTAQNVQYLLLHQLYADYPFGNAQVARKDDIAAVATATIDQISHEHIDLALLAHVLAGEVAGRHLLLYDAVPSNEALVSNYGASGAIDSVDPSHSFHVALENSTATKLDFYTRTAIHQQLFVGASGEASVLTTVTVTNTAPAGQPPSYQFGPDHTHSFVPGQYVGIVYLWSPRGSRVSGATSESGLELSSANVNLLPGQSASVHFVTIMPTAVRNGHLSLRWIPQPTVQPQNLSVDVQPQSGSSVAGGTRTEALTKVTTLSW